MMDHGLVVAVCMLNSILVGALGAVAACQSSKTVALWVILAQAAPAGCFVSQ